jgi:cytochrome c-type biogenesis protein CcmH
MTFWIAVLALIALALLFTLWPFIRGGRGTGRLEHAIGFYEARKAELLRQKAAGEISGAECEAALAEQARMLIALGRSEKAEAGGDPAARTRRRKSVAILALIGIPALAIGIYSRLGAPALPDQPLLARKTAPQSLDVAVALQKIEEHLARNPGDGRGFEVVAPVYLRAGRFDDAVHAFRRVVELLGETPARLSDLGESLVASANGIVNADARKAFERAVALDAGMAKARFYLALAREQDGDGAGALEDLRRLVASLPEGPAKMRVASEIERFEAAPKPDGATPGGDAGKSIAALPQAEREAAIRSMVEALEVRLKADGGTLEDWRRLVQSRLVLGDAGKAGEALALARKALAGDAKAGPVLDVLADMIAGKAPTQSSQDGQALQMQQTPQMQQAPREK